MTDKERQEWLDALKQIDDWAKKRLKEWPNISPPQSFPVLGNNQYGEVGPTYVVEGDKK